MNSEIEEIKLQMYKKMLYVCKKLKMSIQDIHSHMLTRELYRNLVWVPDNKRISERQIRDIFGGWKHFMFEFALYAEENHSLRRR